ncbi:hypothetical protein ACIRJM_22705 [Streptomyces sp. NPDC102405]|uniref:hypothetical protein n=1 Tax=Streptomyces sp. NPDC102405 TaxID=3366170 RepID=UPI003822577C
MKQLALAVKRGDWRAARRARAAAWDEVKKLHPELTRDERRQLGEYKERIRAGEAHDRRKADRDRG